MESQVEYATYEPADGEPAPEVPLRPQEPGEGGIETNRPTRTPPAAEIQQPAVLEQRSMIVEWPPRIRAGDSDLVILTLEMDEEGNLSATAEYEGHEVKSKAVEIPDLYDTHNVVAQARLDMVGVEYSPHGEIMEQMRPGVPVKFIWSVLPGKVGSYRGTIWVHLQFVPLDGSDPTRTALSAQVIDINAVNLVGLGGTPARVIGSVGAVIGAFLSLDKLGGALWRTLKSIVLRPKTKGEQE